MYPKPIQFIMKTEQPVYVGLCLWKLAQAPVSKNVVLARLEESMADDIYTMESAYSAGPAAASPAAASPRRRDEHLPDRGCCDHGHLHLPTALDFSVQQTQLQLPIHLYYS